MQSCQSSAALISDTSRTARRIKQTKKHINQIKISERNEYEKYRLQYTKHNEQHNIHQIRVTMIETRLEQESHSHRSQRFINSGRMPSGPPLELDQRRLIALLTRNGVNVILLMEVYERWNYCRDVITVRLIVVCKISANKFCFCSCIEDYATASVSANVFAVEAP